MKFLRNAVIAAAAFSMVAAPVAASAAPLAQASNARASAQLEQTSAVRGAGYLVATLSLAAIIAGSIIGLRNGSRAPTSP